MNSLTAAWAMRSKRPATVLIIQFPRRSRESQPYTAGTSGHFSIERNTISSIGALVCSESNPQADPAPNEGQTHERETIQILLRRFPRRHAHGRHRDVQAAQRRLNRAPATLRKAVQQQPVDLVALEDFLAAVAGEILAIHPVQFLAQQPEREPREQRIAALDVAPDRERGRPDPVHQNIVHQLHVGTDAPRDVLVLDENERRQLHRSVKILQRMAAAEAGIEGPALWRIALEEIGNEEQPSRLQDRLEDRQGNRRRNVLEAFAEQHDIVVAPALLDRKILEATLENPRPIARAIRQLPAHCVAEVLGRDDAVRAVASVEHLPQQLPRAAADVENADLAFGRGQLRDQHVVVTLLGGGEIAELKLDR